MQRGAERANEIIILNGIIVYPLKIERSIRELDGIQDIAALPLRHSVHQDVPVSAVILEDGSALYK